MKNDDPLQFLNDDRSWTRATVQILNDGEIFVDNEIHNIGPDSYLGALLSADEQSVLWQNETRPLPI